MVIYAADSRQAVNQFAGKLHNALVIHTGKHRTFALAHCRSVHRLHRQMQHGNLAAAVNYMQRITAEIAVRNNGKTERSAQIYKALHQVYIITAVVNYYGKPAVVAACCGLLLFNILIRLIQIKVMVK